MLKYHQPNTTDTAQTSGQNHSFCVIFCSFMRYSCPSGM